MKILIIRFFMKLRMKSKEIPVSVTGCRLFNLREIIKYVRETTAKLSCWSVPKLLEVG